MRTKTKAWNGAHVRLSTALRSSSRSMLLGDAYPTTKAKVDLEVSLELELQKTIKVRKLEELKWVQ